MRSPFENSLLRLTTYLTFSRSFVLSFRTSNITYAYKNHFVVHHFQCRPDWVYAVEKTAERIRNQAEDEKTQFLGVGFICGRTS